MTTRPRSRWSSGRAQRLPATSGRLNKAALFLGAGDAKRAKTELDAVLQIEPGNTDALLGVGTCARLSGDLPGARTAWERVLAIDAAHAGAIFNLAVLEMDFAERPQMRKHLGTLICRSPAATIRRRPTSWEVARCPRASKTKGGAKDDQRSSAHLAHLSWCWRTQPCG
ncbi:MAG: hypothetical protein IPN32_35115 [Deltaproteobacteria bacterium]|nr:hypothetical protein [Deltaproteobacteria bacterium]